MTTCNISYPQWKSVFDTLRPVIEKMSCSMIFHFWTRIKRPFLFLSTHCLHDIREHCYMKTLAICAKTPKWTTLFCITILVFCTKNKGFVQNMGGKIICKCRVKLLCGWSTQHNLYYGVRNHVPHGKDSSENSLLQSLGSRQPSLYKK